jgi:tryptophan 2,3-dioxygenase
MTPINFLGFRDQLNPASGFQSMQFREVEFASGFKDEAVLRAFPRRRVRVRTPARAQRKRPRSARSSTRCSRAAASTRRPTTLRSPKKRGGALYGRRVRAALEVVTHFETRFEEYQLSEALIAHDEFFSLWRYHHVKMVERMLGTKKGTGGSEGVGYLKTTLDKKFFPELWEARTHLDSKHGEGGCPFAARG